MNQDKDLAIVVDECVKCGHVDDLNESGICQTQLGSRNWATCGCACAFPAASPTQEQAPERIWVYAPDAFREKEKIGLCSLVPIDPQYTEYVRADLVNENQRCAAPTIEIDAPSDVELLPCPNPSCGSTKVRRSHDHVASYVYCSVCLLKGPRELTDSVNRWNALIRPSVSIYRVGALREVLSVTRCAIASLPSESLGQDPELGHFYKDELLASIDAALTKVKEPKEAIGDKS
jgi:hypothetical protein